MGLEFDARMAVDRAFDLQRSYSFLPRWIVSPERYARFVETGIIPHWNPNVESVREPLMEHVGHLPVLAAYFYPLIEHRDEIDLGRVLIMLSIHDIGETEEGDVFTFDKTSDDSEVEFEAARKLIPPELFPFYEEFESQETLDAKYAKAIDALAPLFLELQIPPEVTEKRFELYGFNVEKIERGKRPLVEWDKNLNAILDNLLSRY